MLNLKPLTLIPHIFVIKLGFIISDQCSGELKPKIIFNYYQNELSSSRGFWEWSQYIYSLLGK
jgi:hypothetical protein